MLGWVCTLSYNENTYTCTSRFLDTLFRFLETCILIFCFFNAWIYAHIRNRMVLFYALVYVENVGMITAWYGSSPAEITHAWYAMPTIVMVCVGFWVGILFMFVYYRSLAPEPRPAL